MTKKVHLILEFTEFDNMRMNQDSTRMAVQVDNPSLSLDAFDRFEDQLRQATVRLNSLLRFVNGDNTDMYNGRNNKLTNRLDIKNLKVLRLVDKLSADIDVYISFVLDEKEYFGVIRDFTKNPALTSEITSDPMLYVPMESFIRLEGYLVKTIRKWLNINRGTYTALKSVLATSNDSGELINVKEGSKIKVLSHDNNKLICDYNGLSCTLQNKPFYYFNYWFTK